MDPNRSSQRTMLSSLCTLQLGTTVAGVRGVAWEGWWRDSNVVKNGTKGQPRDHLVCALILGSKSDVEPGSGAVRAIEVQGAR